MFGGDQTCSFSINFFNAHDSGAKVVLPSLEVLFFENLHSSNVSLFNEIDIKSIYSVNSALV